MEKEDLIVISFTDGSAEVFPTSSIKNIEQIKRDDHEYVDLGLPSGTKWATCNVGAKTPVETGNYYAWGEIKEKRAYIQENSLTTGLTLKELEKKNIFCTKKERLFPQHDVASVEWGIQWRMPTDDEWTELVMNCDWGYIEELKGYEVIGPNGNTIVIPARGYYDGGTKIGEVSYFAYWSGTARDDEGACSHFFDDLLEDTLCELRHIGMLVRPVLNY